MSNIENTDDRMLGASPAEPDNSIDQARLTTDAGTNGTASSPINKPPVYAAVMRRLRSEEHRGEPTMGGLYESLYDRGYPAILVEKAVEKALFKLDAFIAVPFLNLDYDDEIGALDLDPGKTDIDAVLRRFGNPHGSWDLGSDICDWRWDLYVEGHLSDWDAGHPPYCSDLPYSTRQARNHAVPAGCTIPAVGLEPHEAIQLTTRVNRGMLVARSIGVGPRLT